MDIPCIGASSLEYLPPVANPDGTTTQTTLGQGICSVVDTLNPAVASVLENSAFRLLTYQHEFLLPLTVSHSAYLYASVCSVSNTFNNDNVVELLRYINTEANVDLTIFPDLRFILSGDATPSTPAYTITGDGTVATYTDTSGVTITVPYPSATSGRKLLDELTGIGCDAVTTVLLSVIPIVLTAITADIVGLVIFFQLLILILAYVAEALCALGFKNPSCASAGIFAGLCEAAYALCNNNDECSNAAV